MRYLELTLPDLAGNLALDEALLVEADEEGSSPVLRIWESSSVGVVLGASGRWRDDVKADACEADGVAIARRSSGGGTVVIGPGALNAAVVLRADAAPGLAAVDTAHRYVLDRFAEAIRARGPRVEVLGLGDLTIGGRKFAGSAQRRLRSHFLVHTTILYAFPLDLISRYTNEPVRQPTYRAGRPHDDFLTDVPLPRTELIEAIRAAWLPPGRPPEVAMVPEDRVRALVATKFGDRGWIERL